MGSRWLVIAGSEEKWKSQEMQVGLVVKHWPRSSKDEDAVKGLSPAQER